MNKYMQKHDDFYNSSECVRCGKNVGAFTMSRFNLDRICMGCQEIEKAHPDYQQAVDAELKEIQAGNMNFVGIGKPADL